MPNTLTKEITCTQCGLPFKTIQYKTINVTLNPELKNKVLNREICTFICPHCGYSNFAPYQFEYVDSEHKFTIYQGSPGQLMSIYEDVVKPLSNVSNGESSQKSRQYIHIGVTSFSNLLSKIAMLENGFDFKLATINQVTYVNAIRQMPLPNSIYSQVIDSYLEFDEYNGLELIACLKNCDDTQYRPYVMGNENYEYTKKTFQKYIDDLYPFYFDEQAAIKLLNIHRERNDESKNTIVEIALVKLDNDIFVAHIPDYSHDKYRIDDDVILTKWGCIFRGKITHILQMNKFSLPIEMEDMPVVAWLRKDLSLVTSDNSTDAIDNSILRKMFIDAPKKRRLDVKLMNESSAILCLDINQKNLVKETNLLFIDDLIKNEQLRANFKIYNQNGHRLLGIYLNQKDVLDKTTYQSIYKLNDIVDVVLNSPDKYDGIIINPDTDMLIFPNSLLLSHKLRQTFYDVGKMRKILSSLNEKEIDYIDRFRYEATCKIYFEKEYFEKFSNDFSATVEEVEEICIVGSESFINVMLSVINS